MVGLVIDFLFVSPKYTVYSIWSNFSY